MSMIIRWLCFLQIASLSNAAAHIRPHSHSGDRIIVPTPQRVAFVFAGSARSFITPFVQKTIKHNLVEAFCPRDSYCGYDVFVRVSSNDNNHVGVDSKGKLSEGSVELSKTIEIALNSLEPAPQSKGKLYTQFFEIGTTDEKATMMAYGKSHPNTELKHRVYRDLDPRRYSMYYNRWKAYEMVLNHEKRIGQNYTWVVFGRMDTSWGAPIDSVHTFLPKRIYVPDTWYSDVPDTFAILPRQASDVYFNLETLMEVGVLCLGGPNLDTHTLEPAYLKQIGYNQTEIDFVRKEDCVVMYPMYYNITTDGITWNESGVSELILQRKLKNYGWEIQQETIRMIAVYMFILRLPLEPSCFYLSGNRLIIWGKVTNAANSALLTSCHPLNYDLKRYEAWTGSIDNCRHNATVQFNPHILQHQKDAAMRDSCLLRDETTDMNFMPFRFRYRSLCVTTNRYDTANINMTSCVNYKRVDVLMEMYHEDQLFYFYPLIKNPQKIYQYTIKPHEMKLCLTVILPHELIRLQGNPHPNQLISNESLNNLKINLEMKTCELTDDLHQFSVQMFTFHIIKNPRIDRFSINMESVTNLKPITQLQVRWHWKNLATSDIYSYCMIFPSTNTTNNLLRMTGCNDAHLKNDFATRKDLNDTLPLQSIIIERTQVIGPPIRPGIVLGNFPSWSDRR